jgi:hypothetical protein
MASLILLSAPAVPPQVGNPPVQSTDVPFDHIRSRSVRVNRSGFVVDEVRAAAHFASDSLDQNPLQTHLTDTLPMPFGVSAN